MIDFLARFNSDAIYCELPPVHFADNIFQRNLRRSEKSETVWMFTFKTALRWISWLSRKRPSLHPIFNWNIAKFKSVNVPVPRSGTSDSSPVCFRGALTR